MYWLIWHWFLRWKRYRTGKRFLWEKGFAIKRKSWKSEQYHLKNEKKTFRSNNYGATEENPNEYGPTTTKIIRKLVEI